MIIAVTATRPRLDAPIADEVGDAPFFLVIDTDCPVDFQAVANPARRAASDADILAVSTLVNLGAEVMITRHCSEDAERILSLADVPVYETHGGTPRSALADLQAGRLNRRPTLEHHP